MLDLGVNPVDAINYCHTTVLWNKDSLIPGTCLLRQAYFLVICFIDQLYVDSKSTQHMTEFLSYNKIGIILISVLQYKQCKQKTLSQQVLLAFKWRRH